MDSMIAFVMGEINRDKSLMVFDWDKAATLIRERNVDHASAGLGGDWEWTGGPILRNSKPIPAEETYTFLASTWATPELYIDGEYIACWKYEDDTPGWSSDTYWPESALEILNV